MGSGSELSLLLSAPHMLSCSFPVSSRCLPQERIRCCRDCTPPSLAGRRGTWYPGRHPSSVPLLIPSLSPS